MTQPKPTRREFLAASAAAAAFSALAPGAEIFKGKLHKAMIVDAVTESALAPLKEAGFEGVETRNCDDTKAAAAHDVAQSMSMRIHSVMRGWMKFNSEDPAAVEKSLEETRQSLRAAKAYGADDILLVPCRIGGMPMPEPWEFKIEFDEKTGHIRKLVDGDNSKYEEYIKAHNRAADTSRVAIEKLIPVAEELKIVIGVENVWNNLWVQPDFFNHFVTTFNNPWVRPYFDIGNCVKYSPPQDWIKTLGNRIIRLHFKDFKLNPDGHGGKFIHLREGSINWPAVRKALDEVGYNGWGSIEEAGLPYAEFARRFDSIAEGQ